MEYPYGYRGFKSHRLRHIHRVFRRETALLPGFVRAVRPGDTEQARHVAAHFRDYALGLHHHHTAEDELVWPLLLARVDLEAELVLRMEEQHSRVAAGLTEIEALLPHWEATASPEAGEVLAAADARPEGYGWHEILSVAARADFDYASAVQQGSRIRVATKYTGVARQHFADKGVHVDLIKLYGSMELAPLTGLADAIDRRPVRE